MKCFTSIETILFHNHWYCKLINRFIVTCYHLGFNVGVLQLFLSVISILMAVNFLLFMKMCYIDIVCLFLSILFSFLLWIVAFCYPLWFIIGVLQLFLSVISILMAVNFLLFMNISRYFHCHTLSLLCICKFI
jgi:hypothetical protein